MGFWFWLKALAPVVVVHNRSFFYAIGEHGIMLLFKNIEHENGDGYYNVDFPALERGIEKLPEEDKKQCEKIIANLKEERLNIGNHLAFQYSILIKMGCGHWEHLQDHFVTTNLKVLQQPRCTDCVCGWNRA